MIVYRASSLGACTKRLIAERFGYEPAPTPEKMRKVFDRGNEIEASVIASMREAGTKVTDEQREVVLPITEEIAVVGHVDGMVTGFVYPRVLEIKSMDEKSYKLFHEKQWACGLPLVERYKWQISAYMLATDRECYVHVERNDGEAAMISIVERPFYTHAEIRTRVLLVEAAARNAEIPMLCDARMYPCPFFYLHDDDKEYDEDEEIEALGLAYQGAKTREKAAQAALADLRGKIGSRLGERSVVDTGNVRVSRVTTRRTSLELRRIKEDGLDLSKYEKVTESESIRVTVREENASQGRARAGADPVDGSVGSGEKQLVGDTSDVATANKE